MSGQVPTLSNGGKGQNGGGSWPASRLQKRWSRSAANDPINHADPSGGDASCFGGDESLDGGCTGAGGLYCAFGIDEEGVCNPPPPQCSIPGSNGFLPVGCPGAPQVPTGGQTTKPSCSISVAYSGTPKNKQNVTGGPYSNTANILGPYSTVGRPNLPLNLQGYYLTVQIQAELNGDPQASDWNVNQYTQFSAKGTEITNTGQIVSITGDGDWKLDGPELGAEFNNGLALDYLDNPGYPLYITSGTEGDVYNATFTFDFTTSIWNLQTHTSCFWDWYLQLTIVRTKLGGITWNFTHP